MVCLLRWVLYGGFIISHVDAIFATRPQAIGIDIGPEMITVAHAYSSENVTLPAIIKPELGDPFSSYLFRLRLESWSDGAVQALYGRKQKETSGISNAVAMLFERLVSGLACDSLDTANVSWVLQSVCSTWHGIMARLPSSKNSKQLTGQFTLDDVKDAFVDILTRLREDARTTHNIDIQSPVLALPDFFNQTLVDLFVEASHKVGIVPFGEPLSRMTALSYSSDGTPRENDGKYLIMDLGQYYLDLRILNVGPSPMARNGRLPMDPWGSASLDRDITRLAIERSEILQNWLWLGGSKAALQDEVRRARVLIRDSFDRELLETEDHQDHHHDEYPLHLKDPDATAVLSWADVEAAETKYVQSIAHNIHNFLVAANNPPGENRDDEIPTKIDKAFILTSGLDGNLIKRSLEHALGDVEIIGGRLRDCYLAAEGAAQVGLIYQEVWDNRDQLSCQKDEL